MSVRVIFMHKGAREFMNWPCVAAHSLTRALFANYTGPLYKIKRFDGATIDILVNDEGVANVTTQDDFCGTGLCIVERIYDQSPMENHLGIEHGAPNLAPPRNIQDLGVNFTDKRSKAFLKDSPVYAAVFLGDPKGSEVNAHFLGQGYSNRTARGTATGDQPQSMYAIFSGDHFTGGCCFDYGNAENVNEQGEAGPMFDGSMEAIYWQWGHLGADLENGIYGNYPISGVKFLVGMGGIVLGIGGDNSPWASGVFYEGVMTSALFLQATTDVRDIYPNRSCSCVIKFTVRAMPPKKKKGGDKGAKSSTVQKNKAKIIDDKTFGLKNKKGKKNQQFIKQVQHQVQHAGKSRQDLQKEKEAKEKKNRKKLLAAQQAELAKLLRCDVDDLKKKKGPSPAGNEASADVSGSEDDKGRRQLGREKREAEEEEKRLAKKVKEKTITIEEIEEQRAKINGKTKVTLETFNEWKKKQLAKKRKMHAEEEKKKAKAAKQGKSKGMTGRDLFTHKQGLAETDGAADDTEGSADDLTVLLRKRRDEDLAAEMAAAKQAESALKQAKDSAQREPDKHDGDIKSKLESSDTNDDASNDPNFQTKGAVVVDESLFADVDMSLEGL
eukprot:UC4_evm1s567